MATPASADTLTLAQYRIRLADAAAFLEVARTTGSTLRTQRFTEARDLLRRTSAVTLPSGATFAVDDSGVFANVREDDAGIRTAQLRVAALILFARRADTPSIDGATADARLRELLGATPTSPNTDIFGAFQRALFRFLSGLQGPRIDPTILWTAIGTLGIAVILFVVATLGRALPERVRREVLVRTAATDDRPDPAQQLRDADAALAAGRAREAIHALFLYAIAALVARDALRYDPALTDRELLARTVAIPHADSFADLVTMYERSWFGLREPTADEARRARELATRVAA